MSVFAPKREQGPVLSPSTALRVNSVEGQTLIEFALVFPIFLGIFIGLMAFAILFYSYVTLNLAVREGASAVVHCPSLTCEYPKLLNGNSIRSVDDVKTLVREKCFSMNPSGLNVLVEPSQSQWVRGAQVAVTASYNVPMPTVSVPLVSGGAIRLGTIQIQAQSVMTVE